MASGKRLQVSMNLYEEGFVDCYAGVAPKMTTGSYAIGFEVAREEIESPEIFDCDFVTFKHYPSNPGIMEVHLEDKSDNREALSRDAVGRYLARTDETLIVNQDTAWKFARVIAKDFQDLGLSTSLPN